MITVAGTCQNASGGCRACALAVTMMVASATATFADEVTSKDTRLRGSVKELSADGVTLAPEYGAGTLVIPWKSVDDITTVGDVQVLHGEDAEVSGPIKGKRGDALLVGEREIDVATIYSGIAIGPDGATWRDRMRSRWRYWDGNLDLGFNLQQSTTDTMGLAIVFETVRRKAPTRLVLGSSYRYGTQKEKGESSTTTQDELKGLVRGEYDLGDRLYGYASGDAEYDGIERISVRSVPKVGAGYTLWSQNLDGGRQNFLRLEAGPGWVYEKYFGGSEDNYFTIAFGALATYYLPYSSKLDWRFDYLPAVDDWANNYLLRTTASLAVPLLDPISAKFAVTDEYNSRPANGADANSLFVTIGLSLGW